MTHTTAELMAVVLSREIRNGEWGACGAFAQIPMAAFRLARATHAPDTWWLSGGGGALNGGGRLVRSSSDPRTWYGAEGAFRLEDIVDFELGGWRRLPTVGIFGGMQVDAVGSVNMVGVGGYPDLDVRGPGTVGLVFGAYFHRTMIYVHRHDRQVFVPKVDIVSSPGHTASRSRWADEHAHGPELIVTPLCVFAVGAAGTRLVSLHPESTVEEVLDRTGFDVAVPSQVPTTDVPTGEELHLLREVIDPAGVLETVPLR